MGGKTSKVLNPLMPFKALTNKDMSSDDKVKNLALPLLWLAQKTPEKTGPTVINPDAQTFVNPAGNKMVQAKKTILSRSVSSSGDVLGGTTYLS